MSQRDLPCGDEISRVFRHGRWMEHESSSHGAIFNHMLKNAFSITPGARRALKVLMQLQPQGRMHAR